MSPENSSKNYLYHVVAIVTVMIWGTTFVSTKVLINNGMFPTEIFFLRFLLAYPGIWLFSRRTVFADSVKDELLFVALGLCGGSLYFLLENTALQITLASNVSLIVCSAPIFTALLLRLFYRNEVLTGRFVIGSLMALVGVALVAFNGNFILKISPVGDVLSLLAAISWAFYTLLLRQFYGRYSILFITRKVFFYGMITALPFVFFGRATTFHFSLLARPVVFANLLYLGLIASMACYLTWNKVTKELGVVKTSNYIYLNPVVTLLASAVALNETITPLALTGSAAILLGIYLA